MKILKEIGKLISGENKPIDIWYYIQGMYRYNMYYGGILSRNFSFIANLRKKILRKHIIEQIAYRIKVINPECYSTGSCIKCGCMTTALQMTDKSCEGWCYPRMLSIVEWNNFKSGFIVFESKDKNLVWELNNESNMYELFSLNNKEKKYRCIAHVSRP